MRGRNLFTMIAAIVACIGVFPARAVADAAPGAPPSTAAGYRMDPSRSHLTAQVEVGGMMKHLGHPHTIAIRDFHGEVQADPGNPGNASLRMTFVMSSLTEVGKEFDEKDREKVNQAVREEALETSRYPSAELKSRSITARRTGQHLVEAEVKGDLTLHGVTHSVAFPAKVRFEGDTLHASGAFTILHSAYGIERLSAGGGTIKAKDPIQVSFDLVAEKKSP